MATVATTEETAAAASAAVTRVQCQDDDDDDDDDDNDDEHISCLDEMTIDRDFFSFVFSLTMAVAVVANILYVVFRV